MSMCWFWQRCINSGRAAFVSQINHSLMHDWLHSSTRAETYCGNWVEWTKYCMHRQKSFCPDRKAKVPAWYRGCSDWQALTHNISIPLKCAPSNFRRDWIKSLSAVEVRQRLGWGPKTPHLWPACLLWAWRADLALSEELSQAQQSGTLHWAKQDHGERQGVYHMHETPTQTSLHICVFNYVWCMNPRRLYFILRLQ